MKKETQNKTIGNSTDIGNELALHVLRLLAKKESHSMPSKEITEAAKMRIFEIAPKEDHESLYDPYKGKRETAPKWLKYLYFQSIKFVKTGMMSKQNRVWRLEEKGLEVLKSGKPEDAIVSEAAEGYRKWKEANKKAKELARAEKQKEAEESKDIVESVDSEEDEEERDIEKLGLESIQAHIETVNEYEYQELVAALLRGMGHHVAEIAPPGADGGIDIVAYKDPLGAAEPRVKVQVKHQKQSVSPDIVRALNGKLKSGDMGIVVCSSSFSKEARREARDCMDKHIRLIDGEEFIELWQRHYLQMDEQDRAKMPLKQIYVLDSDRIMDE